MILLSGHAKSNKLVQTIVLSIVCTFFVKKMFGNEKKNTVLMINNFIKYVIFTKLYNLFGYCQIT